MTFCRLCTTSTSMVVPKGAKGGAPPLQWSKSPPLRCRSAGYAPPPPPWSFQRWRKGAHLLFSRPSRLLSVDVLQVMHHLHLHGRSKGGARGAPPLQSSKSPPLRSGSAGYAPPPQSFLRWRTSSSVLDVTPPG